MQKQGQAALPRLKCNSKRRGFKIHCTVKFLKQRPCLREVTPEGCECWTPSLDSPGRLGGRSQPCILATVPSIFSFFAFGDLSNLDPRPLRFRFGLTTPTAGAFAGWSVGEGSSPAHAPNSASRPIRLQAPTPGSQSSEVARTPVGGAEAAPQT